MPPASELTYTDTSAGASECRSDDRNFLLACIREKGERKGVIFVS